MNVQQFPLTISFIDLRNYFFNIVPFARIIHDKSVVGPFTKLQGRCVEVGAGKYDYRNYAVNCTEYIRSNNAPTSDSSIIYQDATSLDFESGTLDSVVMLGTLEHIYEYETVIKEVYRVLKPGGYFVLTVPWLFPYHGAPRDYHRFSIEALKLLFKSFSSMRVDAVGNYWTTQAIFLQRPSYSRTSRAEKARWFDYILRAIGIVFIIIGRNSMANDDNYAALYSCLFRK